MNNLISFIVIITLLFLTSCTKEEILQPQSDTQTASELVVEKTIGLSDNSHIAISSSSEASGIYVTKNSSYVKAGELIVDFSSSHDFTGTDLEATQTLDFIDGNNNVVTLTFQVNSYVGSNGELQAAFAIGGNNLGGLDLGSSQIIVEELVVN